MLGAVGEILGALGVIATLGYLASQIRESTRAAKARAAGELLDLNHGFLAQLAQSVESAALWRRGMAADPDLTDDELIQFHAMLLQLAFVWQRAYHLEQTGHVEAWFLEPILSARRELAPAPGFKRWLGVRGRFLTNEFRSVLERETQAPTDYSPLGVGKAPPPDGSRAGTT